MKLIIDYYKGLDTFNVILFWGVIIVILLLLIFSIMMINKNRKLKTIIISNGIDFDDDDEIAIKRTPYEEPKKELLEKKEIKSNIAIDNNINNEEIPPVNVENNSKVIDNLVIEEKPNLEIEKKEIVEPITKEEIELPKIPEEKKFIAEEFVMDYPEKPKEGQKTIEETPKRNIPYQKNVLRDMYSNQTSPIGIVKNKTSIEREYSKAEELNNNLKSEEKTNLNTIIKEKNISSQKKHDYLEELKKRSEEEKYKNTLNRTSYEIQQEEDAIISYEELMQKKDSIKIVDEEDAIISIDELIKREKEKLYNLTPDEKNESFIDELKKFRSDL